MVLGQPVRRLLRSGESRGVARILVRQASPSRRRVERGSWGSVVAMRPDEHRPRSRARKRPGCTPRLESFGVHVRAQSEQRLAPARPRSRKPPLGYREFQVLKTDTRRVSVWSSRRFLCVGIRVGRPMRLSALRVSWTRAARGEVNMDRKRAGTSRTMRAAQALRSRRGFRARRGEMTARSGTRGR